MDLLNFAFYVYFLSYSKWLEPIVAMWCFTKTNSIAEGVHRKMKLVQRRAYGFKNVENYRLRACFFMWFNEFELNVCIISPLFMGKTLIW